MAHFAAMFGGYGGRDDRDRGNNPIALLATMILAPIAAMLIQMAISRSREFAADAGGAAIAGNPYGLADALRKIDAVSKRVPLDANPATAHMFIVKPFSGGGLMSLFSSHPPTEARIARAARRQSAERKRTPLVGGGQPAGRQAAALATASPPVSVLYALSFQPLSAVSTVSIRWPAFAVSSVAAAGRSNRSATALEAAVEDFDIPQNKLAESAERVVDRALDEARRRDTRC